MLLTFTKPSELFGAQPRSERYATVKELMTCLMRDGNSVREHGVHMIWLIEKLVTLEMTLEHELCANLLLLPLPSSFDGFVVNFNMNKIEATLEEMVNMLVTYEATFKKDKSVLLVGSSSSTKKGPSAKGKKRSAQPKKTEPKKKHKTKVSNMDKSEDVFHHCNKPGHWKRNCKEYLEQLRTAKGDVKKS
ncbi:uncharacterized protein [Henckelia pumila]|uniref:uncharacterized protein n=1 Tax=Henckelia pumila TaxID=405737 RepID=UPI003C6E43F3